MSYVVLARKWRPMRFSDLVGQDHVARTLGNAIDSGRVAHAFLFTGVRGVGKTTSARILAKALNCMGDPDKRAEGAPDPGPTVEPCLRCSACKEIAEGRDVDVQEIDGASYNGVDEVRKLQDSLPYRPNRDRHKIVIVDEVHMLTQAAWNAFLKTLEEPPPHVKFIFATTEVHKVPITILSRVQRFDFKMIPTRLIMERLRWVLDQEELSADDEALTILAHQAAGSMRDAMSLLDQVIAFSGETLHGQDVAQVLGVASRGALLEIAENLVQNAPEQCLRRVSALADQGFDIPKVARDLLALLRDLVVAKVCEDPSDLLDSPDEEQARILRIAESTTETDLMRLHSAFSKSFDDVVRGADPRAGLEMLLVRLAGRPELLPVDELLHRIAHLEKRLVSGTGAERRPPKGAGGGGRSGNQPNAPRRPRSRSPASPKASSPEPTRAEDDVPDVPEAIEPDTPVTEASAGGVLEAKKTISESGPEPKTAQKPEPKTAQKPEPKTAQKPEPKAGHEAPSMVGSGGPNSEPSLPKARRPQNGMRATPSYEPPENERKRLAKMAEVGKELVNIDMELAAYFDHLVPLEVQGKNLRLGMERGMLFGAQLSTSDASQKIAAAAIAAWGDGATVQIVENSEEATSERTLSAQKSRDRAARHQAAVDEVRRHPRVVEACEIFGAQVKNVIVSE